MRKRRCDNCGEMFRPRKLVGALAGRVQRRCSKECADVVAFARLAAFNERKKRGEVLDKRRGVDIVCPTCGITYAAFRSGFSFTDARRDFITDDPNRKTGAPRRHGRRHGVLGKMREWKQLAWNMHVDQCASVATEGAA